MSTFRKFASMILMSSLALCSFAHAYPVLDAVVGLPHPELVTVYPDDADPNLYYFVPTRVALAMDPETRKPRLGVQYWGLTGADPAGKGAALTFSLVPDFDRATVDRVADGLKKTNPNARFAFPTLVDSSMDIVINGHYVVDKQDTTKPSVKGGTVDATQAFSIALADLGARAFAQGTSPDSDILGARYTFKFTGVAKRLYAKITVEHKRVYDHFKSTASSSSWWGMVRTSWSADWQKLVNDGSIKIEILQGGETDNDAYMLEVFKSIVNAKIGETGMFAPKLQPGAANINTGSAPMGWGFSGGAAWEHLEEHVNYVFVINTQKLEDREFSTGLTFSAVCARYPDSFVDLTKLGNKCIDKTLFEKMQKSEQRCVGKKIKRLDEMLAQKVITFEQWVQASDKAYAQPCATSDHLASAAAAGALTLARADMIETSRHACRAARLKQLQGQVASKTISPQQAAVVQRTLLSVPCNNSQVTGDKWYEELLRNQKNLAN